MAGSAAALAAIPLLAQQRPASGPIARYDMRAGTVSGTGAMGGGGMGMAAMLGGGGGNSVQHELLLRLGSSNGPAPGAPRADHFMPPVAKLGKSVALVTPREERGPSDELPNPRQGEKPKGRMVIFWAAVSMRHAASRLSSISASSPPGRSRRGCGHRPSSATGVRPSAIPKPSGAGRPRTASSPSPTARCWAHTALPATTRPSSTLR